MCVSLDDGAGDQAQGHRTCVQKVKGHLDDADKSADDKERCVFTLHVTGHVIYNAGYKFGIMKICFMFSAAHQGCIYLINSKKIMKYCFLCEYVLNCNLFLYFQHH